jgi:hypothetical protein
VAAVKGRLVVEPDLEERIARCVADRDRARDERDRLLIDMAWTLREFGWTVTPPRPKRKRGRR